MTKPSRTMWNYRCDSCFAETPVYCDTDLCYYCDPANAGEIEESMRKLDGLPPLSLASPPRGEPGN